MAWLGIGRLYVLQGAFQRAVPVLERAVELARLWNIRGWFSWPAADLGWAYTLASRIPEAVGLLEQAVERDVSTEKLDGHSFRVARLSRAYLLDGRIEEAMLLAERALGFARDHKERGNEAWVLHLLGEVSGHLDHPDTKKAEADYRQALALADELGMRPLVAHCHLGLGKLYGRTGDRLKAQEHLNTGATMLRDMDMRFWLEQAEAELKALGSKSTKKTRTRK